MPHLHEVRDYTHYQGCTDGVMGALTAPALSRTVVKTPMRETEELGVADDRLDVGDDKLGMDEEPGDGRGRPVSMCLISEGLSDASDFGARELIRIDATATVERRGGAGLEIPGPGLEARER
jgi:hypothetical protein